MRLGSILVGTVIVTLAVGTSRAEVLLGLQAGAGHLRLSELEDFWDEFDVSHDTDDLAFQWEVSGTWRFAPRHAVRLSVERITSSTALHAVSAPLATSFFYSDQNFETIPVCIGYEFTLRRSGHGALTLAGVGGGVYATKIEGDVTTYSEDPLSAGTDFESRKGNGYGFHGYLRQTAPISERLSMSGMIRGRWADGMAFDDSEGEIPVEFTDIDFAVGLEWKI